MLSQKYRTEAKPNPINIISIYLIYPIRGRSDYRGIYDIGLKRAFMGYRGLLLNAPYKKIG
jgi:hypothetical protein